MDENLRRIQLYESIENLLKDHPPYTKEELGDWQFVTIKPRRYFHYEKFPGFVGPENRRFIFFEWLWLLIYNFWSWLFKRLTHRTLWRFTYSEPVGIICRRKEDNETPS